MMSADAASTIAVTTWNVAMPPSIRALLPRRAPTTDAENAMAPATNAARTRNVPMPAIYRVPPVDLEGSYFDGHFAITPFGATRNPSAVNWPLSTTSDPVLNVSGTTPV